MAIGETVITIVGNLTADPELRTTGQGAQVASFTIANTARVYNKQTGQYEDGPALFMRCSAWRDMASHCAQSLAKGMRVIAQGRLQQHSYQAQDGTNRTVMELQVDEIGPSLRYATAQVSRISRQPQGPVYGNPASPQPTTVNTGAGGWSQQPQQTQQPTQPAPPADDPWSAPTDGQSSFGEFGKADGEPDF
nr:MAG TPA: Single stranded DNA binding protein [Caudoviricetes sp.]